LIGDDNLSLEYWLNSEELDLDIAKVVDKMDFDALVQHYSSDADYTKKRSLPNFEVLEQAIKYVFSTPFMRRV
jgi:hypothetical protein